MTTERQKISNAQNSKASTGPQSVDGRAKSARNSLRHGITANKLLLDEEDPEEFASYLKIAYRAYDAEGAVEEELVRQIAIHDWRSRRHLRAECASLSAFPLQDQCALAPQGLKNLGQYAAGINRSVLTLEKRLKALQELRRRVDILLPPIDPRFEEGKLTLGKVEAYVKTNPISTNNCEKEESVEV